ncbi:MAG: hypothetical protein AB1815_00765 [Bacillota bacterium]
MGTVPGDSRESPGTVPIDSKAYVFNFDTCSKTSAQVLGSTMRRRLSLIR